MIIFNQGMLLLGSNHFLKFNTGAHTLLPSVFFKRREIEVYPDSYPSKPSVGKELNKKAEITLEKVWPNDKTLHKPITVSKIQFCAFSSTQHPSLIIRVSFFCCCCLEDRKWSQIPARNNGAAEIPIGSIEMSHVVLVSHGTCILPSLSFFAEMRSSLQSI